MKKLNYVFFVVFFTLTAQSIFADAALSKYLSQADSKAAICRNDYAHLSLSNSQLRQAINSFREDENYEVLVAALARASLDTLQYSKSLKPCQEAMSVLYDKIDLCRRNKCLDSAEIEKIEASADTLETELVSFELPDLEYNLKRGLQIVQSIKKRNNRYVLPPDFKEAVFKSFC